MSGIDLDSMTLVCHGKSYRIPLNPPMSSYRDARERAVQMDRESLEGLGRSDVTIKEFSPPTGLWTLEFALISATFLGYSQRWWFVEGQIVEQILGAGFAHFSWTIQPYLITFMLALHTSEMVYLMRNKLVKHSVNPRTRLFWLWTGTKFVEGLFSFKRFNDLVKAKHEAKAKKQH